MANNPIVLKGTKSDNYIQQINAGGAIHDIAVQKGITFYNGNGGSGTSWDGTQALEVVIPTISDLVQDPIRFAGTVGSDGIAKKDGVAITPAKGDLVFITANCTFNEVACEAGDMAVYDGKVWSIVSGENQVTIKNATPTTTAANKTEVELSLAAKTVLDVEGKELVLKLPAKLLEGITVTKNTDKTISFNEGAIAGVDAKYITLTHTPATQATSIGSNKSIALPSKLANGQVTFTGDTALVKPSDIANAWTAGTNGSHSSAEVAVSISGGVKLTKGEGGDFVTGWTPSTDSFVKSALKSASLKVAATKPTDEAIAVNPVLTTNPTFKNDATEFATGITTTTTGADFTIPGAVSVSAESAKPSSNGVVVDVTLPTLGEASTYTDVNYATGSASNGVIASIADPTVKINNGDVVASATVSGHVLTFTTATVTATATQGTATYKKAQYKKTVFSNTPGISYGSIQTAAGTGYKLNKKAVNASLTPGTINYIGVETTGVSAADKASAYTGLTPTKGAYTAALSNVAGTIASGKVITSVTDASVPTLGVISGTGVISGSVATTLTTSNVTVGTFASDSVSINIGTWALEESDTTVSGGIAVGKPGNAAVKGAITIGSGTYVTNVSGVKLS